MDRKFLLALVACLAFTFLLQVAFDRFGPRRVAPRKPARESSVAPAPQIASEPESAAAPTRLDSASSLDSVRLEAAGGWLPGDGPRQVTFGSPTLGVTVVSAGARLAQAILPKFQLADSGTVDLLRTPGSPGDLSLSLNVDGREQDLVNVPFALEPLQDSAGAVTGVRCVARHSSGLLVERTYQLKGEYELSSTVRIDGVPAAVRTASYALRWRGGLPILERNPHQDESSFAVASTIGTDFEQEHLRDFGKTREHPHVGNVRWVGVRSKYFACAVVPPANSATRLLTTGDKDAKRVGFALSMPLRSGEPTVHSHLIYLGPIEHKRLETLGVGAEHMASLGWSWTAPLARLLLWCLVKLHDLIPNYGIGIIIISALARVVFYPLTRTSFRSMAEMQKIQPLMQEIQRKYKGNPERLNKETMALFREHKVNPLGGCIPMLVQMPVFVALFGVLSGAVQLRDAHFALWIKDLSSPDVIGAIAGLPIHVLPLIMTATSLWQAKLTPTDPRQAAMTYMMPVLMMFMFYSFPAGTVLYWTVNNLMTIAQQYAMKMHHPLTITATSTEGAAKRA